MSCHCLSKMMKHHCQIIDIKHYNDWSTWKNKFQRNLTFCSQYKEFMNTLMRNGYTKKSSDSTIEGKCWYIFCHGVYNESKPNKIRVVFYCSTECQGRSLNDELMSGPDLTNQIKDLGKNMFDQVRLPERHQNFLNLQSIRCLFTSLGVSLYQVAVILH